jgi:hypothetical protein
MNGEGFESPAWTTIAAAQSEAHLRLEQGNPDEAEILSGVLSYLASCVSDASTASPVG